MTTNNNSETENLLLREGGYPHLPQPKSELRQAQKEPKPIYQWQYSRGGALHNLWWQDCNEADFRARDNKPQFNVRILYETSAIIESVKRENEALRKIMDLQSAPKGGTPCWSDSEEKCAARCFDFPNCKCTGLEP